jgi:NADPH:quinone reductase-like Zn-dependent oxidoreductase
VSWALRSSDACAACWARYRSFHSKASCAKPTSAFAQSDGFFSAAGQTVLILGAGGAVGSVAVQLARSVGAHVIGAGRSNAESLVLELGADRFVDLEQDA